MSIPTKYNSEEIESKWYQYWLDKKLFKSTPNEKPAYTIVIPPPNVTGILHMGHMLNNTLQDVLIRRARMRGYNACWVPGTDHASIATEAKVVAKLKEQNINKADLSREEFLKHAWDWTDEHGGKILNQLQKLGCSCDWDRTKFTLDPDLSESVTKVFVDLYNKGLIYRGYRMVNWDPEAKTTLSDEEVIFKEKQGKLYYIRYQIQGEDNHIVIATTRPETLFGDTAICINPDDERHTSLKGKQIIVPIIERIVPIIEDTYVDLEFGTGCLKVTPAHDINDKALSETHKLDLINIFNDDASLNENGAQFKGMDRFKARKAVVAELEKIGALEKIEDYTNNIGTSERTGAVIEPRLSDQWFLKMEGLAKPALDVVMDDSLKLFPSKFKNTYRHWMENIHDWNISRQLWWGHQIPAYFYGPGKEDFVVAQTAEQALELAKEKTGKTDLKASDLTQDPDALDTWFSAWLWPISVFDGIRHPDNEEINYYYPSQVLVTGPDILFFWVARMIVSGLEYRKEIPFKSVYLTGIVRDQKRRKMSKSLGNSPDPIELMKKYSTDGVRLGLMLSASAGNDLLFEEELCEQGRNFTNKIWNAFRLIKGWEIDDSIPQPQASKEATDWFQHKFQKTLSEVESNYEKYRISDSLMGLYKLTWDDFCSWYLESIKPAYQQPIDTATYHSAIVFLEDLLKVLHPFMPFLSEEIWHLIKERNNEAIMVSDYPVLKEFNERTIQQFEYSKEVVTAIRSLRTEKKISPKEAIEIYTDNQDYLAHVVQKLANISKVSSLSNKTEQAFGFRVGTGEYFVPLSEKIDLVAEKEKLSKELIYLKGFLLSVEKKLSNERFVSNAPVQVIDNERKKMADAQTKMEQIKAQLTQLN